MTLVIAMLLDAALGEPKWLWSRYPHPAVMMGRLVGWCDKTLNQGTQRSAMGILAVVICCAVSGTVGWILQSIPGKLVDVLTLAILLAQRSLVQHVAAVGDALRLSLGDGKLAVSQIVGRDTADMNEAAVARSAIESAAENLSDGVIAPIFWFALFGLPGVLIYKCVNTADSMIGYRTPRHEAFGWAAARLDDLLNLMPARLTAILIWLATNRPSFQRISAEAPRHRSSNAGWPEAAMAYGLDVALSGPRSYDGELTSDPFVNENGLVEIGPKQIDGCIKVMWKAWALMLGLALAVAIFGLA